MRRRSVLGVLLAGVLTAILLAQVSRAGAHDIAAHRDAPDSSCVACVYATLDRPAPTEVECPAIDPLPAPLVRTGLFASAGTTLRLPGSRAPPTLL